MSFTPPKRAPGDPPFKYGIDIPKSWLAKFDARVRGEIEAADKRIAEKNHDSALDKELDRTLEAGRKKRRKPEDEDHSEED